MLSCFSHVQPFVTPWTVARQAPLSMGFSSKNTGVGCHTLLQGIFPTWGLNPCLLRLLHCRPSLLLSHQGSSFSKQWSHSTFLPSMHENSAVCIFSVTQDITSHFDFSYTRRCVVTSLCGFICLSLMTSDTEYPFMCLFAIYVSSLAEWLFKSFAIFYWVICLLV